MKNISIIIPTYNRINSLLTVLKKLENQDFNKKFWWTFEIIIINDWSEDWTQEILEKYKKNNLNKKFELKILLQENKKQWTARNLWVKNANSNLILFLQDDIFPEKNLISKHYKFHKKNPREEIVLIWKTIWLKEFIDSKNKKFYEFLDWSWKNFSQKIFQLFFKAPLFNYNLLKNNLEIDSENNFFHFYTNNLSIKKDFYLKNWWFNEQFNSYWWEDIEFWYRLHKQNMKLFFLEVAKAEHNHKYNLEKFLDREKKVSENLEKFLEIQPQLKKNFNKNKKFKKIFYNIFCSKIFLKFFKILNKNFYWYFLGKKEYLKHFK
jgi:glycosyltransferase involved in cell wall biosynthesis